MLGQQTGLLTFSERTFIQISIATGNNLFLPIEIFIPLRRYYN